MDLMHRITHENDQTKKLLASQSKLPIGYAAFVKKNQAEEIMAEADKSDKRNFARFFVELGEKDGFDWMTPMRSYFLYNFLRLTVGDRILVPSPGQFSIFEVTGVPEALTQDDVNNADLGFAVTVKPIAEHLPRNNYLGSALTSKLKYRGTNLVLSTAEVDRLIETLNTKTTITDFSATKDAVVEQVQKNIIDKLTPDQLELLVKNYLENLGADKTYIPSKKGQRNDNDPVADIDVMGQFNNLGIAVYVQVKHHKGAESHAGFTHAIAQLAASRYTGIQEYDSLIPVKWLVTTAKVDSEWIEDVAPQNIRVIQNDEFATLLVENRLTINADTFTNTPE